MTNRNRWLTILVIAVLPLAVPLLTLADIVWRYHPGKWSTPIGIVLLGTQAAIAYAIMFALALAALLAGALIGERGRYLRTLLGFVVAPLVIPLALALSFVPEASGYGTVEALALTVAVLCYAAAILIGTPLYILLRALKWTGWISWLAWGVVVAVAGKLVFASHGAIADPSRIVAALFEEPHIWWLGALSGLVFWLIVRPDRAVEKSA